MSFLLLRQVRRTGCRVVGRPDEPSRRPASPVVRRNDHPNPEGRIALPLADGRSTGVDVQRQAWLWAVANRAADGSLPSGKMIAARYGRHERWGRLVKSAGAAGQYASAAQLSE